MSFAQLIEYRTSRPDEVRRVLEDWEKDTQGKRRAQRALLLQDRDAPERFCELVFFESHDAAMDNSDLPETQEYAGKFREAIDGEPRYVNFDVLEDRRL